MTIITKTTDKKKLLPIPTAPLADATTPSSTHDTEAAVAYARHRARTATLLVCLLGILVLLTGVLAGVCFYRQYLREKVQRLNLYMPYDQQDLNSNDNVQLNSRFRDGPTYAESFKTRDSDSDDNDDDYGDDFKSLQNFFSQIMAQMNRDPMRDIRRMESVFPQLDDNMIRNKFFKEEFEIKDDEKESYSDIKIPDFREGRRGRFIHDYKNNQTTIVDEEAKRCFVYPLDYTTTLPPQSMYDIILKMQTGYYYPDTNVLRKKMRVITPELDHDDEYVSDKIRSVCSRMHIYKLEPFVGGVYKRSIMSMTDDAKFAEFAGKGVVELDLVNLDEIKAQENS
ncbi:uncharacterized protein [Chironomus tepperi]|uniref:uncharacterized protein n=1 Tax=Chironomus tepperi TaxID=113505 RepID=UPI00391F9870